MSRMEVPLKKPRRSTCLRELKSLGPVSRTILESPPTFQVCAPRTQVMLSVKLVVPVVRDWPFDSRGPQPKFEKLLKTKSRPLPNWSTWLTLDRPGCSTLHNRKARKSDSSQRQS